MNIEELEAAFEKHDEEYLEFNRVQNPLHPRKDVCAFMMLHNIFPGKSDMVSSAEHDEIFLSVLPEEIANKADEATIIDLIRCGIRYSREYDCFAMFV